MTGFLAYCNKINRSFLSCQACYEAKGKRRTQERKCLQGKKRNPEYAYPLWSKWLDFYWYQWYWIKQLVVGGRDKKPQRGGNNYFEIPDGHAARYILHVYASLNAWRKVLLSDMNFKTWHLGWWSLDFPSAGSPTALSGFPFECRVKFHWTVCKYLYLGSSAPN